MSRIAKETGLGRATLYKYFRDVDAILVGHAHVDIPMREVVNEQTGKTVVLCEPFFWAKRVARFDITLKRLGRGWRVAGTTSTTLPTNTVDADPAVAAAVEPWRRAGVDRREGAHL